MFILYLGESFFYPVLAKLVQNVITASVSIFSERVNVEVKGSMPSVSGAPNTYVMSSP